MASQRRALLTSRRERSPWARAVRTARGTAFSGVDEATGRGGGHRVRWLPSPRSQSTEGAGRPSSGTRIPRGDGLHASSNPDSRTCLDPVTCGSPLGTADPGGERPGVTLAAPKPDRPRFHPRTRWHFAFPTEGFDDDPVSSREQDRRSELDPRNGLDPRDPPRSGSAMSDSEPWMHPPPKRDVECVVLPVKSSATPSGKPPVRIFLGTEAAQYRAERIFLWSIERVRDPARVYEIHRMIDLPGFRRLGWNTGFTNYRFAIPALAGGRGRAIYNDVDQIYLRDPAELFDLPLDGHGYLAVSKTDTSVMLLDCARMARFWPLADARRRRKYGLIKEALAHPGCWGPLPGRLEREGRGVRARQHQAAALHHPPQAALATVPRALLLPAEFAGRDLARARARSRRSRVPPVRTRAAERALPRRHGRAAPAPVEEPTRDRAGRQRALAAQ